MSRYVKYFQSLLASDCAELAVVANIAGCDRSSTTGINLYKLGQETGLNPWVATPAQVREVLLEKEQEVPVVDQWRVLTLERLLERRHEIELAVGDTTEVQEQIDSLCSS